MKRRGIAVGVWILLIMGLSSSLRGQQGSFDVNAYKEYLSRHRDMSGSALLTAHPAPLLADGISGDVSQAEWLDSISIKYGLTTHEQALIARNGFMVSQRLQVPTFQRGFTDVWMKDLPAFISTDAILHALHMSYDEVLKQVEKDRLISRLADVLIDLRSYQATLENTYGAMPGMQQPLRDVDLYIAVAGRLLQGSGIGTFYTETFAEVEAILQLVDDETPAAVRLFSGEERTYDFSQFIVRGHYSDDVWLSRYFQAMMWLGRTELMLTAPQQQGTQQQNAADIQRQTIDAALLLEALENTAAGSKLRAMDVLLTRIVGESDNVRPQHLRAVLDEAGVSTAADLLDTARVAEFQRVLATKEDLTQRINSQILCSDPMNPDQIEPPVAFLLMGQRFVIDSYVMGQVVYDRIMYQGRKVGRLLPSVMDVLFATGNDAAAQLLEPELTQYPYASNLNALRYLVDSYDAGFWSSSIYNGWLDAIRTLNIPEFVDDLPPFMQTAAWWQEKMNTQLASWAQLRHDNLLYAKPSYTSGGTCFYPDVYVEPIPAFYARVSTLATDAAAAFETEGIDLPADFFRQFAATMDTLEIIAGKELAGEAFSATETAFLKKVMYLNFGCTTDPDGWYTYLFYTKYRALKEWHDPTVGENVNIVTADVHTVPTDLSGNTLGWVLHVGTGYPELGVFVVQEEGRAPRAYVGPVYSYYQHRTEDFERLDDKAWKQAIDAREYPRPDWTHIYLADHEGNMMSAGPSLKTGTPAHRQALLSCTADAPEITAISRELRYDPMPFPVTATVRNIGNALSDSVYVRITLPPDLALAGDDAPDRNVKLLDPAQLFQNATGTLQFSVMHPPTAQEKRYTVHVAAVEGKGDSAVAEVEVVIPAMEYPQLAIGEHNVPFELQFVDSLDSYMPNPFTVHLACVNRGNAAAHAVTGTLELPAHMVFDPPTQFATQAFTPAEMPPWHPGDPAPEVAWTVRWESRLRYDAQPVLRFVLKGEDGDGVALDSVDHRSQMHVPGLQPDYYCNIIDTPDSLAPRADGTGVEPNPFTVRYVVRNTSHQTGKLQMVVLYIPTHEGVHLHPSSPNPLSFRPDVTLAPGEEVTFTWHVDVVNRITPRKIQVQTIGYDDEGMPLPCDKWISIAAVEGRLAANSVNSASVLRYDPSSDSYAPETFTYTGRLRVIGAATLQDIEARLRWEDPSGLDLIVLDPSVADTTNPKTRASLGPNEEAEFTWGFRLVKWNSTDIPQYLHFTIDYTARGLPAFSVDSSGGFVEVEPVVTLGVIKTAAASLFHLHANHPNPFAERTTFTFDMQRRAHARLSVHNLLGEEVAVPVDAECSPGRHHVMFTPGALPPGMYVYRLQVGGHGEARMFILLP